MQLFAKTIRENRDFKLFLSNPIINHGKKLAILKRIFTGKVHDMTLRFFLLLTEKNREAVLDGAATDFIRQYNLIKGIEKAQVTTAVALDAAARTQLNQKIVQLTGKTVELEEKVDPAIIGGFLLRVGDKQVDDTIRTSLRVLKNKFKENPYVTKL
jgi:F-type H+-transporting ATPase subunit delta